MRSGLPRALLLAATLAPAAFGQFSLFAVNGGSEQPVSTGYSFGPVDPGVIAAVQFRIRNSSSARATLDLLTVTGTGFSRTAGPTLPAALDPQQAVDFTVSFQAGGAGSYSAALQAEAIAVLLTATVPVRLTYQVDNGGGFQPLGPGPVDFGTVQHGSSAARHFRILNQTAVPMPVPAIAVSSSVFAVSGAPPTDNALQPTQTAGFDVLFSPNGAGTVSGSLMIGDRTYVVTGTGVEPPLPRPQVAVSLAQMQSAQQGSVTVNLDAASLASATGSLSMTFQAAAGISAAAAADPAIAFAAGGQTVPFTVSPGDTLGHFGGQAAAQFQTGTTAGTLTFTAQLGSATSQQVITIAAAPVGFTAVQAIRSTGSLQMKITGFDNTRTAGALTFTFLDASGNTISPGAIHTDSTAAFASYFPGSGLGGVFLLTAVFPVTGDVSGIASCQVQMVNSAGTATSGRTSF